MTAPLTTDAPILLPLPAFHGTLAAIRCLGAAGIRVVIAESDSLVPAVWSRFAARRVRCPDLRDPDAFVRWLLEFGDREPGHVLYPTSDDLAWLYAKHRDELSRKFVLRHPGADVTYRLLNKVRLREEAEAVGLRMPRTWLPRCDADFARIEAEARFPVAVKPQTQILFHPHLKGVTVRRPEELRSKYAGFLAAARYSGCLLSEDPGVSRPTVQEYYPQDNENVYGISGFIDPSGDLFAARAARKILQLPRQLGVGLVFEEAAPRPELISGILALCRRVGYHGVFEAEFIDGEGTPLLIDFNPRFYGQMAFDIARGLPQPLLAYDAAVGRWDRLRARIEQARSTADGRGRVYCRGLELKLLLICRRLFGSMSRQETSHWWRWLSSHRDSIADAVFQHDDRLPGWLEALHHLVRCARHPRSFVRQLIAD